MTQYLEVFLESLDTAHKLSVICSSHCDNDKCHHEFPRPFLASSANFLETMG